MLGPRRSQEPTRSTLQPMNSRWSAALGALVLVGVLWACGTRGQESDQAPADEVLHVPSVADRTTNDYFTVDTSAGADLVTSHAGGGSFPSVQFTIDVSNTNQIEIRPVAELDTGSGDPLLCEEDELRRHPNLTQDRMTIEVPCPVIPEGVERVVIRGE